MTAGKLMVPHSRPTLGEEEVQAVAEVIRSGHVAQGPCVQEFERSMAAYMGLKGAVAVGSGSVALELALLALGIGEGDEVILPSYVCTAPWLAVVRVGALPRIVDIQPSTYGIDPEEARKALSSKTKAIIVPHPFGLPADLTRLQTFGIPLIEDCAQTLGAAEAGRTVGTVGIATVCSFYATKLLCTGEGGMVLSNDPAMIEKMAALRDYDERPSLEAAAFNRKMTDLQAALGLRQVARLPSFLAKRSAIAEAFTRLLGSTGLGLPQVPRGRTHVFFRYVVRLPAAKDDPGTLQPPLEQVLANLERRGIQCRRPVFQALHQYLKLEGFPASEEASHTALSVPIYPSMTEEEVRATAEALCEELP